MGDELGVRRPEASNHAGRRSDPSVAEAGSRRKRMVDRRSPADRSPSRLAAALLRTRPAATGEHLHVHCRPLTDLPGILLMAVPKRVLARAVDRNLVRRLVREAWRAAALQQQPVALLVKLARRPAGLAATRASRSSKKLSTASSSADSSLPAAGPAVVGRSAVKRQLRAELDRLFAAAVRRLAGGRA
ncbi:MAG: ribonuclease P protein component [Burkholderiaceae bacterium]